MLPQNNRNFVFDISSSESADTLTECEILPLKVFNVVTKQNGRCRGYVVVTFAKLVAANNLVFKLNIVWETFIQ